MKARRSEKPYDLDPSVLHRYDQRHLIFNRVGSDPSFRWYRQGEKEEGLRRIAEHRPGYTRIDYALSEAAWSLHDGWEQAFKQTRITHWRSKVMGDDWHKEPMPVTDPAEMTMSLKKAALFLGASLVGVAEVNPLWLYENWRYTLEPLELPAGVRYAVVLAFEMNTEAVSESPSVATGAATALGYSRSAFTAASIAEFIRNLGYAALPAGNDMALSVPLAVDAGLGEVGRSGILITPEYGSRVQLAKIFTDLPLKPDEPVEFGVRETCRSCKRCAKACEAGAISMDDDPSWTPACSSSSPGALKWYLDGEKCYGFWVRNGMDCSTCISVCPYSKALRREPGEFWAS
jgi:ferredoxin